MANVARKWFPPVLIVLAVAASVAAAQRLPASVSINLDGLLPWHTAPSDLAPRWMALWLVPVLALLCWIGFLAAPTAAGQRLARRLFPNAPAEIGDPAQFERFGKTYDAITLGVVFLIVGFHAGMLAAALGSDLATRIIPVAIGASLLFIGNVMPRLRPNWVAGLRTQRLLSDPEAWRYANRVFARALVASGLITLLVALVGPRYSLTAGIAALLVSSVLAFIASRRQTGGGSSAPSLLAERDGRIDSRRT